MSVCLRLIFLRITLLLTVLPVIVACSDDDDSPELQSSGTGRTVLVYMVARNSLGSYSFDSSDIDEMVVAARNGALGGNRLILFHSRYNSEPVLKEVTASGVKELKRYSSEFVAVDEDGMRSVIDDVKAFAPAESYGIVLWSHANGWLQTGVEQQRSLSKRAFGDDAGKSMNITSLARALRGEDFDFVYFDCCFMGGVEVAYELRDVTQHIVASVSELPSTGMPYDLTLPYLMADDADVVGAASATFSYYDALEGNARTCTMSVIDTEGLPMLAATVRELYAGHPTLPAGTVVQQYVSANNRTYYNRFFDLGHYLWSLTASSAEFLPKYEAAMDALDACVTYKAATPYLWQHDEENSAVYEVEIEHHCGLSTFIMQTLSMAATEGYDELAWYRDVASVLFDD